eukprot:TRINITY_DN619_c0_g1_i1.p1 TRINITY_DN619_c0_g1~~TRINITY_DN619_c0_g1_i1.p1  ORF type:complete len:1013 (-),score=326.70 TRINITY_DN619_c0_g1_i1:56-3094(-)
MSGSALWEACFNGHVDQIDQLVQDGANIEYIGAYGSTSLSIAAQKGHADCVERMLFYDANASAIRYTTGATALHVASLYGNLQVVKILIGVGLDVNARQSSNGWTPLHCAAKGGFLSVFMELLEEGSDPAIVNNEGRTALQVAIKASKENEKKKEQKRFDDAVEAIKAAAAAPPKKWTRVPYAEQQQHKAAERQMQKDREQQRQSLAQLAPSISAPQVSLLQAPAAKEHKSTSSGSRRASKKLAACDSAPTTPESSRDKKWRSSVHRTSRSSRLSMAAGSIGTSRSPGLDEGSPKKERKEKKERKDKRASKLRDPDNRPKVWIEIEGIGGCWGYPEDLAELCQDGSAYIVEGKTMLPDGTVVIKEVKPKVWIEIPGVGGYWGYPEEEEAAGDQEAAAEAAPPEREKVWIEIPEMGGYWGYPEDDEEGAKESSSTEKVDTIDQREKVWIEIEGVGGYWGYPEDLAELCQDGSAYIVEGKTMLPDGTVITKEVKPKVWIEIPGLGGYWGEPDQEAGDEEAVEDQPQEGTAAHSQDTPQEVELEQDQLFALQTQEPQDAEPVEEQQQEGAQTLDQGTPETQDTPQEVDPEQEQPEYDAQGGTLIESQESFAGEGADIEDQGEELAQESSTEEIQQTPQTPSQEDGSPPEKEEPELAVADRSNDQSPESPESGVDQEDNLSEGTSAGQESQQEQRAGVEDEREIDEYAEHAEDSEILLQVTEEDQQESTESSPDQIPETLERIEDGQIPERQPSGGLHEEVQVPEEAARQLEQVEAEQRCQEEDGGNDQPPYRVETAPHGDEVALDEEDATHQVGAHQAAQDAQGAGESESEDASSNVGGTPEEGDVLAQEMDASSEDVEQSPHEMEEAAPEEQESTGQQEIKISNDEERAETQVVVLEQEDSLGERSEDSQQRESDDMAPESDEEEEKEDNNNTECAGDPENLSQAQDEVADSQESADAQVQSEDEAENPLPEQEMAQDIGEEEEEDEDEDGDSEAGHESGESQKEGGEDSCLVM